MTGAARADMGPAPGGRYIWNDFIFTVERDYADYEFYLLPNAYYSPKYEHHPPEPEKLQLSPESPVRVSGPGEDFRYGDAEVYAVQKSQLTQFKGSPPPRDWLRANLGRGVEKLTVPDEAYRLYFRTHAWFYDRRDRAEFVYRVEMGPDGGRLVKVSENTSPWGTRGLIVAGVLTALGAALLGRRLLRQLWQTKQTEPGAASPGPVK
jgi:hypothetical protein